MRDRDHGTWSTVGSGGAVASYILGLDVGTGSAHCMLADPLGRPITAASAPMAYFSPQGCSSLAREFDPEAVLETLGRLIVEVLKSKGVRAREISAVGVTSQRQGGVFLGTDGNEIYSGPNVDLRAIFEGATIDEEFGKEIYATTGHFPSLLLAPARLRWFRENRPTIYNQTRTILSISGWLAYRLTGHLMSEASLEGEAGLLDITRRERCSDLTDRLGVPGYMLPPLSPVGAVNGSFGRPVEELWGLKPGTPVVMAGADSQCGLLGMGIVRPGQAGAVLGWSGSLQVLTPAPCHDKDMRTWVGCYPLDGLWVADSSLGDAGNAYRWLKDTLLGPDASFDEAEELAGQATAASQGVLALLGPAPVSSLKAGLKMGGLIFPSPVSFQDTSRGQLLRAALDNIAFSIKANLAILAEVTGRDIQSIYLGGGMSSSRALTTTLATIWGSPVSRSRTPQVSARGAALAAAVSSDPSLEIKQVAESAADDCIEVEPGTPSEVAEYEAHYYQWLRLYERMEWE